MYELYSKCTTANYTLDDYGFLIAENRQFSTVNRFQTQIIGNATIDKENCGEDSPECGKLIIGFPSAYTGKTIGPYWVLATDYGSFATVWSCTEYGSYHFKYVWILGRQEHPATSVVKAAMRILKINGINDIPMADTNQNNCPLKM
ncbi:apolipoprotein D-like [Microplitis demolitor]|uniref:apolipoprotein D-like n=1 Tax=Microplitis demolitor TaxID=69319 RepID=UPI0004CD9D5E|nr:apolipoprotein D-like [Microplitis demolitor]